MEVKKIIYPAHKRTQEKLEAEIESLYDGRFSVVGKFVDSVTAVEIVCNKCGYVFTRSPQTLHQGRSICPRCNPKIATLEVIRGVSDLCTTDPDIANLLLNKDDGVFVKRNSAKVLDFVCPNCNRVISKKVANVTSRGKLVCPACSDHISYPNKFIYHLLSKLGVDFDPEFIIVGYPYRYDYHFSHLGIEYLIEMDGGMGHGNVDIFGSSKEDQIARDNDKDIIAIKHGYSLIRIDCKYKANRFEYVKNSVINSKLSDLFDLSVLDMQEIDRLSMTSVIPEIAKAWNSGIHSYYKLKDIFKYNRPAIRRYLKMACIAGIIPMEYADVLKEIRIASNRHLQITKGTPVKCLTTGEEFVSIAEAQRKYQIGNLHEHLHKKRKYCGKLKDGTKLAWCFI